MEVLYRGLLLAKGSKDLREREWRKLLEAFFAKGD